MSLYVFISESPGGNKVPLTFDNLLRTGIVDLLLGCVGRQHSVKYIWLPLLKADERKGWRKHIRGLGLKSTNIGSS